MKVSLTVTFLGTSASVPTPKRNLSSVLIHREGEQIMFDCGEGIQRQMITAGCSFHRKMKVLITHMHGDHMLGLPGLLQTMAMLNRQRALEVYGPRGITDFLRCIKQTVQFGLTFSVEVHEIEKSGTICTEEEYTLEAASSNHALPSFAYALVEKPRPGRFFPEKATRMGVPEGSFWSDLQHGSQIKLHDGSIVRPEQVLGKSRSGRKIVYTGDTKPFRHLIAFSAGADLLIHEATLNDDLAEKAVEEWHSTPGQAAKTAKGAKVKQLILTHVSARYEDSTPLLRNARRVFRKTTVAEDFLQVEIPLSKD